MTSPPTVGIGPFVVGEIPAPLAYDFQEFDGTVLDLSGYTVKFYYREKFDQTAATRSAVLQPSANKGRVVYSWTGTDLVSPGHYSAQFFAGNGVQRYASNLITFDVASAVGPIPAI
jgi:hypothetical protein